MVIRGGSHHDSWQVYGTPLNREAGKRPREPPVVISMPAMCAAAHPQRADNTVEAVTDVNGGRCMFRSHRGGQLWPVKCCYHRPDTCDLISEDEQDDATIRKRILARLQRRAAATAAVPAARPWRHLHRVRGRGRVARQHRAIASVLRQGDHCQS